MCRGRSSRYHLLHATKSTIRESYLYAAWMIAAGEDIGDSALHLVTCRPVDFEDDGYYCADIYLIVRWYRHGEMSAGRNGSDLGESSIE